MKSTQEILDDVCLRITDCIFFYLQHDREFMDEYLAMSRSKQEKFNRDMGMAIPEYFSLKNGEIATNPHCTLIKSYTTHHK